MQDSVDLTGDSGVTRTRVRSSASDRKHTSAAAKLAACAAVTNPIPTRALEARSTVRYIGIEVDDALEIAEHTEV